MNASIKRSVFHTLESYRTYLFSGIPFLFFLFFIVCNISDLRAQRVAVKTNIADWITVSPNLGLEFTISNRLSIDLSIAAAPFKIKEDLYYQHIRLQPELRYWFLSPLTRHYAGITAFYSTYDIGYKKKGYYGDSYAAGLTYGYNRILSRRWNLELSAGVGAIHYRMIRYTPGTPHPEPNEEGWKIAPVKLGVAFVYILK